MDVEQFRGDMFIRGNNWREGLISGLSVGEWRGIKVGMMMQWV
jgi:hypothetical protein